MIARAALSQKSHSKEIQGREEGTMNPKDNDSTEIALLRILKYKPSAEMTGKVFLSLIKNMKTFKCFVAATLEQKER